MAHPNRQTKGGTVVRMLDVLPSEFPGRGAVGKLVGHPQTDIDCGVFRFPGFSPLVFFYTRVEVLSGEGEEDPFED